MSDLKKSIRMELLFPVYYESNYRAVNQRIFDYFFKSVSIGIMKNKGVIDKQKNEDKKSKRFSFPRLDIDKETHSMDFGGEMMFSHPPDSNSIVAVMKKFNTNMLHFEITLPKRFINDEIYVCDGDSDNDDPVSKQTILFTIDMKDVSEEKKDEDSLAKLFYDTFIDNLSCVRLVKLPYKFGVIKEKTIYCYLESDSNNFKTSDVTEFIEYVTGTQAARGFPEKDETYLDLGFITK